MFIVSANAAMVIPNSDMAKDRSVAPSKSPVISDNWELEKVDFIHYAKSSGIAPKGATPKCYNLLGYKWKSLPVKYTINPTNPYGLTESFVAQAISNGVDEWDRYTTQNLFYDTQYIDYGATWGILDTKNALVFGNYPDDRVIAVTRVWFTKGKSIVEFDVMFNTMFRWGDATNPPTNTYCAEWQTQCTSWYYDCTRWDNITYENGTVVNECVEWQEVCGSWQDVCIRQVTEQIPVMDLQNIATHELGHGVGLNDIYDSQCSGVTMYGYSNYMEVNKRTLEKPDITGLQQIY
jgi:hypothetical protein